MSGRRVTLRGVAFGLAGHGVGRDVARWVRYCGQDCAATVRRPYALPYRLEAVTVNLWHGYGAQA